MEQVDLVRALESIDHSDIDILAHHVHINTEDHSNLEHDTQHHLPIELVEQTINKVQQQQQQEEEEQQEQRQDVQNVDGNETDQNGINPIQANDIENELNNWTRDQLQAEIIRLRQLATRNTSSTPIPTPIPSSDIDISSDLPNTPFQGIQNETSNGRSNLLLHPIDDSNLGTSHHSDSLDPSNEETKNPTTTTTSKRGKRKRASNTNLKSKEPKSIKIIKRDENTGKRLEKDRKTELSKLIRIKIRNYLGVGMDDLLPHPHPHSHSHQPSSNTDVISGQINDVSTGHNSIIDEQGQIHLNIDQNDIISQSQSNNHDHVEVDNGISNIMKENQDHVDINDESANEVFIPNWNLQLNHPPNVEFVNKISNEVYEELSQGLYSNITNSNNNNNIKIPPNKDISLQVIEQTTKTSFINMCKKYIQENDPNGNERREKYTKKRRRWARKDLKQKRRTKSSLDPIFHDLQLNFSSSATTTALHIDYMSSEYSSSGEDTSEEIDYNIKLRRKNQWEETRRKKSQEDQLKYSNSNSNSNLNPSTNLSGNVSGKNGWAVGISEKVLEVRTPRWRSDALNDIYKRLDAHASQFSDTRANGSQTKPNTISDATSSLSSLNPNIMIRPGHVAPSHKRFTMVKGTMRKGNTPKDLGQGWMWASGIGGVWPEEADRWIGNVDVTVGAGTEDSSSSFDKPPPHVVTSGDTPITLIGNSEEQQHVRKDQVSDIDLNGNDQDNHHQSISEILDNTQPSDLMEASGIEVGNDLEEARLGLVNALEGL
ncbi:uncharacterized protein L201_003174 [Kwoniella dendrophila CBS 6074]|uniref:Rrn9 domain-containing protein n=1 Tax=Kwoniella dendrophila CBS 6074 TaxID=1295534 RepID=A0AAX4JS47_9TREE